MPAEVTEDAVLGGKLRLKQPSVGHRVGHDAILLAAACPARAGERVVDLGAGVGAAGLALARRVDGVKVVLVEVDAALAALAAENAQLNGVGARVSAVALDVAAPARAFAAAGLTPESVTPQGGYFTHLAGMLRFLVQRAPAGLRHAGYLLFPLFDLLASVDRTRCARQPEFASYVGGYFIVATR